MTFFPKTRVFGDSGTASVDAFERWRVSNPTEIFVSKNLLTKDNNLFRESVSGSGVISYLSNEVAVQLSLGTGNGDYAIRESSRSFAYVPGKSLFLTITGVLGVSRTNTVKRIGYFDDRDGLFFELDSNGMNIVRRSYATGSVVEERVSQSEWNIDKMDGTGPSRITLDTTKTQIFIIDFQWLGVGRVRYGFDIDGKAYIVHQMNHANNLDVVYMSQSNLPIRYELRNTGVADGTTTMKEICSAVMSEGGYSLVGFEKTTSHGVTPRTGITAATPVIALRLSDTANSKLNRTLLRILNTSMYLEGGPGFFEFIHVRNPSGVNGTWNSVGNGSFAEVNRTLTAFSGDSVVFHSFYQISGVNQGANLRAESNSLPFDFFSAETIFHQNQASNNSDMFVVRLTPLSGTLDTAVAVSWIEYG